MIDDSLPVNVSAYGQEPYDVDPPDPVDRGGTFTIRPTSDLRLGPQSTIELTNPGGAGMETNFIHTSCSQPLQVGDVFGSLTLVAFSPHLRGLHRLNAPGHHLLRVRIGSRNWIPR